MWVLANNSPRLAPLRGGGGAFSRGRAYRATPVSERCSTGSSGQKQTVAAPEHGWQSPAGSLQAKVRIPRRWATEGACRQRRTAKARPAMVASRSSNYNRRRSSTPARPGTAPAPVVGPRALRLAHPPPACWTTPSPILPSAAPSGL